MDFFEPVTAHREGHDPELALGRRIWIWPGWRLVVLRRLRNEDVNSRVRVDFRPAWRTHRCVGVEVTTQLSSTTLVFPVRKGTKADSASGVD